MQYEKRKNTILNQMVAISARENAIQRENHMKYVCLISDLPPENWSRSYVSNLGTAVVGDSLWSEVKVGASYYIMISCMKFKRWNKIITWNPPTDFK